MDICHASISPLTFEQEHKFLQAIKTMTRSAYQKCNFEVDHQVLKNLSQEKSYGYLLQGKSIFYLFFLIKSHKWITWIQANHTKWQLNIHLWKKVVKLLKLQIYDYIK